MTGLVNSPLCELSDAPHDHEPSIGDLVELNMSETQNITMSLKFTAAPLTSDQYTWLSAGDSDGDGIQEIFCAFNGIVRILEYTTSNFTQKFQYDTTGAYPRIISGRFDNDSLGEIAITSCTSGNNFLIYESTGNDTWISRYASPNTGAGFSYFGITAGQFDPDGSMEIIIPYGNYPQASIRTYENTGDNTYVQRDGGTYSTYYQNYGVALADVDNDGYREVINAPNTGDLGYDLFVWESASDNTYLREFSQTATTSARGLIVKVGNADGDSYPDIVVGEETKNQGYGTKIRVFETTGTPDDYHEVWNSGTMLPNYVYSNGATWSRAWVYVEDLTGDGIDEIIVGLGGDSMDKSEIFILTQNGNDAYRILYNFSLPTNNWCIPIAIHDVDIDGNKELLVGIDKIYVYGIESAPNVAPSITSPVDIAYLSGTSGHQVTWTITDPNTSLRSFEVRRDGGIYLMNGAWTSGVAIPVNVDGLSLGTHSVTINASDGLGGISTDTVIVSVYSYQLEIVNPQNTTYINQFVLPLGYTTNASTASAEYLLDGTWSIPATNTTLDLDLFANDTTFYDRAHSIQLIIVDMLNQTFYSAPRWFTIQVANITGAAILVTMHGIMDAGEPGKYNVNLSVKNVGSIALSRLKVFIAPRGMMYEYQGAVPLLCDHSPLLPDETFTLSFSIIVDPGSPRITLHLTIIAAGYSARHDVVYVDSSTPTFDLTFIIIFSVACGAVATGAFGYKRWVAIRRKQSSPTQKGSQFRNDKGGIRKKKILPDWSPNRKNAKDGEHHDISEEKAFQVLYLQDESTIDEYFDFSASVKAVWIVGDGLDLPPLRIDKNESIPGSDEAEIVEAVRDHLNLISAGDVKWILVGKAHVLLCTDSGHSILAFLFTQQVKINALIKSYAVKLLHEFENSLKVGKELDAEGVAMLYHAGFPLNDFKSYQAPTTMLDFLKEQHSAQIEAQSSAEDAEIAEDLNTLKDRLSGKPYKEGF